MAEKPSILIDNIEMKKQLFTMLHSIVNQKQCQTQLEINFFYSKLFSKQLFKNVNVMM